MKKGTEGNILDVLLIGGGIMSATLGTLLSRLAPEWKIKVFERMDRVTAESSEAWNNAGTGHSAFCELNYTPEMPDGRINIDKAVKIAAQFEVSKQFWASMVEAEIIKNTAEFIHKTPHMSFVWGDEDVSFLNKRYTAMQQHPLFKGMQFTTSTEELSDWMPLVMQGRHLNQPMAATRMDIGTDVNFGALTRNLFTFLEDTDNEVTVHLQHEVEDISRTKDGHWRVEVKNLETDVETVYTAKFVFIGAGGGSLPLLEKSDIPEGKGYGGFPISGQWLVCNNAAIIQQHAAKVYGKAKVGAPPMSVPHLDARMIDGQQALFFGPFAGFSTKFLKNGSYMDLPLSVKWSNLIPLISAGLNNIPLTKYLIEQVTLSEEDRMQALREYYPDAKNEDWALKYAGQRVQVIKKDAKEGGVLEFGTEVVCSQDGTLATLLGASPGASTSVSIMLDVLQKCFPQQMATVDWQQKIKQMIPSYGQSLAENADLLQQVRTRTHSVLGL